MTTLLAPCPFCGADRPVEVLTTPVDHKGWERFITPGTMIENFYNVFCNFQKGGCGATGGAGDNETQAVDKWNRRGRVN